MLLALGACTTGSVPQQKRTATQFEGKLDNFFSVCDRDMHNAVTVITERELIKNLTHLHRMNEGGKKYYLLERETISEMIQSVTTGVYSDFILINKHGVVVYTRVNDDLFGKNVRTSLKDSPLERCFQRTGESIYVDDVAAFPDLSGNYYIFLSSKISKDGTVHGIFILQLSVRKIREMIDPDIVMIGRDGRTRIVSGEEGVLEPYPLFNKIMSVDMNVREKYGFSDGLHSYTYYPFVYHNLTWIIIEGRQPRKQAVSFHLNCPRKFGDPFVKGAEECLFPCSG